MARQFTGWLQTRCIQFLVVLSRQKIADEVTESVFDKVDAQDFPNLRSAGNLDRVNVVPSISIETVVDDGIAKDKPDLATRHARPQLVDHLLGDDVALLDRDAVYSREPQRGTGGQDQ